MYLFIDTEFVAFDCTVEGLISLGCVTDRGDTWYGVHQNYPAGLCSAFVRDEVLPPLFDHKPQIVGSLALMGGHFADWLDELGEPVILVIDYMGDWYLLREMLDVAGIVREDVKKRPEYLWDLVFSGDEADGEAAREAHVTFFEQHGLNAHNALSDALANRSTWLRSVKREAEALTLPAGCRR